MDLQDYVLHVLRRDLALPSQQEWLGMLGSQPTVAGLPSAVELLDEQRQQREQDLDRRVGRR